MTPDDQTGRHVDELAFDDWWALRRLKYLRLRSLNNLRYRDAAMVERFLIPRYMHWATDSPLEALRVTALRNLANYKRLHRRGGTAAGPAWQTMLTSVDALLAEGDRLHGRPVKPGT